MPWLAALPLVLLPIVPVAFAVVASLVGLWAWLVRREQPVWLWAFVAYAVLGVVSQGLVGLGLEKDQGRSLQTLRAVGVPLRTSGPANLFQNVPPTDIHGWNAESGSNHYAVLRQDPFYAVALGRAGRNGEVLYDQSVAVQTGHYYTESLVFKTAAPIDGLAFTFFTRRGHHPVKAEWRRISKGLWLAWSTYRVEKGDDTVRGPDLLVPASVRGPLLLCCPQLSEGRVPLAYLPPNLAADPWGGVLWWLGTALTGLLVLMGARVLFRHIQGYYAAIMLLVGMSVHIGVALQQYLRHPERVAGLTSQPNILGHWLVSDAALTWLVSGAGLGLVALLLAAAAVYLSGSRAALVGWFSTGFLWTLGLRRRWWIGLMLALVLFGAVSTLGPGALGRLSTTLNPDYATTEARFQIWRVALTAFEQHPLEGVGINRFRSFYVKHLPEKAITPRAGHAHDLWLQLLAGSGVLGLLGFLTLYGSVIWSLFRWQAGAGLGLLAVILILNIADYTFFDAGVYYVLWAGLGFVVAHEHRAAQASPVGSP